MSNFTEDQKLAILKNFILENADKNVSDIFNIVYHSKQFNIEEKVFLIDFLDFLENT